MKTMIAVNKAHYPVNVLGYGRRIGIWLQGCDIRCTGCVSQDTWEDDPGREIPVSMLIEWCRAISGDQLDGITITGGEPFYQPEALVTLLEQLHSWRCDSGLNFDILCYSGHTHQYLLQLHRSILQLLDVLIPEPFCVELPWGDKHLCGSENQQIVTLSALGKERYESENLSRVSAKMQVSSDGGRLWFIGIPARGDMERVEKTCRAKGLTFEGVSWRA